MTVVIGVLNKKAIAIAADSAVTVSVAGKQKIFNDANKIFALSKKFPIGVMTYNSAEYMHTPWETIIKLYRKHSENNTQFKSLIDVRNDFVKFLKNQINLLVNDTSQKQFLTESIYYAIYDTVTEIYEKFPINNNCSEDESFENIKRQIISYTINIKPTVEFKKYSLKKFLNYASTTIDNELNSFFENRSFTTDEFQKFKEIIYSKIISDYFLPIYTGLVFVGYGENEIFPSLYEVKIAGMFDGKLKYIEDEACNISWENESAILPFAQTDVISTILTGSDNDLDKDSRLIMIETFKEYNEALANELNGETNVNYVKNMDVTKIADVFFKKTIINKREKHVRPLLRAVSLLSKQDLAEMAESMVHLTYLKRRMTNTDETVGGPVDVAIISKGDGFIWIKRKHYFKPELNHNYFKHI